MINYISKNPIFFGVSLFALILLIFIYVMQYNNAKQLEEINQDMTEISQIIESLDKEINDVR